MQRRSAALVLVLVALGPMSAARLSAAEEIKLPPEVTPALRAACEQDVRRLCIGENPTIEKVKRCVEQKFSRLNMRCRVALASAGFGL
jgi:hypothetical protein